MRKIEIEHRITSFAVSLIQFTESLPRTMTSHVIARQLIRSGTSIGANYRAACRAKSTADFLSKLKIVEEESDETLYWLDLLIKADIVRDDRISLLRRTANEITSIIVASIKTLKSRT